MGTENADALWDAIAAAVVKAPVYGVRVAPEGGMLCEVRFELSLRARTAIAVTSGIWHMAVPPRDS